MKRGLSELGELGVIGLFRQAAGAERRWAVVGIGDDCAVLDAGGAERLLVTTDALIEGVHFLRDEISARQLGHKAMAVNLSDVAAMGGEPTAAFLALALTADLQPAWVEAFRDGLLACAREHRVDLLGGDTVRAQADVGVCLTVLGRALAPEVVLRSGMAPGHVLFLGGRVGASAAGLHLVRGGGGQVDADDRRALLRAHLEPDPQVGLGRLLGTRRLASAMIDVSDGVLHDLGNLCAASRVGAELDADALPLAEAAVRLAASAGLDALDWGLTGGEDYCLLFSAPAERAAALQAICSGELGQAVYPIGRAIEGRGVRLLRDGAWHQVEPGGFDHFEPGGRGDRS